MSEPQIIFLDLTQSRQIPIDWVAKISQVLSPILHSKARRAKPLVILFNASLWGDHVSFIQMSIDYAGIGAWIRSATFWYCQLRQRWEKAQSMKFEKTFLRWFFFCFTLFKNFEMVRHFRCVSWTLFQFRALETPAAVNCERWHKKYNGPNKYLTLAVLLVQRNRTVKFLSNCTQGLFSTSISLALFSPHSFHSLCVFKQRSINFVFLLLCRGNLAHILFTFFFTALLSSFLGV